MSSPKKQQSKVLIQKAPERSRIDTPRPPSKSLSKTENQLSNNSKNAKNPKSNFAEPSLDMAPKKIAPTPKKQEQQS